MKNQDMIFAPLLAFVSILLVGGGIGWLIGLSASPVVSIVITSVTGSAAALIATMSGLKSRGDESGSAKGLQLFGHHWAITPWPLAVLMIGILIGSSIGIRARNDGWLGSDVSIEISKWTAAGLSQDDVARRLFEHKYPIAGTADTTTNNDDSVREGTLLFTVKSDECDRLHGTSNNGLQNALAISNSELFQTLAAVEDADILRKVVEIVCDSG
ncbi:hypothetical protein KFU94_37210 [Chloroflexi bacterium TSY]|nr:hypothetical protein [Chloroflexi bacterium TSY]